MSNVGGGNKWLCSCFSIKWFHGSQEIFSYISSQSGGDQYTFVSDFSRSVNITVSNLARTIKLVSSLVGTFIYAIALSAVAVHWL